jgi:hypothetical protein
MVSAILVTKVIGGFTRSDAPRLRWRSEGLLALLCRLGGHSYELYDAQSKFAELAGCNTLARPRTREHPNPKIKIIIYKVNLTTCTRRHTS